MSVYKGYFDIIGAIKKGYLFVWTEYKYLMRIAWIPFVMDLAALFLLSTWRIDAGLFEVFLWRLPAEFAFAWFLCVIARFIFLKEDVANISPDKKDLRRIDIHIGITSYILFKMTMVVIVGFIMWSHSAASDVMASYLSLVYMMLIGLIVWGIRFGVVYVPASLGISMKKFLRSIHGMSFSFYLVGMYMLAGLPFLPFLSIAGPYLPFLSVLTFIVSVLLNVCAMFAVQEILSRKGITA